MTQGAAQTPGDVSDDPLLCGYLTPTAGRWTCGRDRGWLLAELGLAVQGAGRPAYQPLRDIPESSAICGCTAYFEQQSLTHRPRFSIALAGWQRNDGTRFDGQLVGPLMDAGDRKFLMRPQHWGLFKEVVSFSRRSDGERDDLAHRQTWGRIRKLALEAGALLDDFLYRSVVLTPEKLQIQLRRSDSVKDDRVVEIAPDFEGSPPGWIETFDRAREVH
ncbi:MAG: hypothetical protein IPL14_18475 [Nitrospira sp.]|nr:hypothetical protein [Nitrospira sp.]